MDGAERLVRGCQVTLRIPGAAPEHRACPARAARHEVAFATARTRHLERKLVRRWRAILPDVGAVRIAIAAHERPEPAALDREHPAVGRAAGRARLARAGHRREVGLLAGKRPRLLVLGVQRAGEEPSVSAEPDHHRVTQRADLVGRLGREVLPAELLALLVHERPERCVELPEEGHPGALPPRDLVELFLHASREREVHVAPEVLDEKVGHDLGDGLGVEPALPDRDVAAVDDRRERRRIGGGTAHPELFERLHERRLGEARRRLREVLRGRDLRNGCRVALGQRGKRPLGFLVALVAALRVHPAEAVEEGAGRRCAQVVSAVREVDRGCLQLLLGHLARQRALPDQAVQARLVTAQRARERLRVARERRGPDRLVGLLGVA